MTVAAIWCRHEGDNLIGIGDKVPWQIKSDKRRFWEIVDGQTLVCGRKTYESLPVQQITGCRVFVMTHDAAYDTADKENHFAVSSQKALADLEEDIYVAGGEEIYNLFMTGKEALKPHIVVDCVYHGAADGIDGARIDISDCVGVMEKKYRRISPYYCLDGVTSSLWVRKGEFVEQSVLKRIIGILENEAELKWQL